MYSCVKISLQFLQDTLSFLRGKLFFLAACATETKYLTSLIHINFLRAGESTVALSACNQGLHKKAD